MADIVSSSRDEVQVTPRQLAQRMGWITISASEEENTKGYVHATALLRILEMTGMAKKVGAEPTLRGKGKGQAIWSIPAEININFRQL